MFNIVEDDSTRGFIWLQGQIENKYNNDLVEDNIGGKRNIATIDKFLVHITEELGEFFEIVERDDFNLKDITEEFLDVLMYSASLLWLFEKKNPLADYEPLILDIIEDFELNISSEISYSTRNYLNNEVSKYSEIFLITVRDIRKMYPERKWHKKFSQSDIDPERLNKTRHILEIFIKRGIKILNDVYYDEELRKFVNKIYRDKYNFIFEL